MVDEAHLTPSRAHTDEVEDEPRGHYVAGPSFGSGAVAGAVD
jgi:hypothetical protein